MDSWLNVSFQDNISQGGSFFTIGRYILLKIHLFYWLAIKTLLSLIHSPLSSDTVCTQASWSRVLSQKLLMSLSDKFSTFYGTQSFISMCTRACHWSLSSDRGHANMLPPSEWRLPFRLLHLYCTCIYLLDVHIHPAFQCLCYHLASVQ